jgi:GDP-4-dehydro-6-deoxy-D-mannose reductase
MQRVIVTGANGFVGNHLLHELDSSGIETIGVGYSSSRDTDKLLSLDLTNPEDCSKLDFSNVSGVIHLAGLAAVGASFAEPMKYIQTNMGIEVNLFETALKQKTFPRFLIISSGSLYDPEANLPLTEESATIPSSPYAISKLGQEQIARYYSRLGFECIVARPFNHIGPGQGPGFIVPDLAQQVNDAKKADRKEIKVGDLSTKRDYTDVRDIDRAYGLLLEKGRSGETYNVCSGIPISGQEILDDLAKAAGIKVSPVLDPSKNRPVDNPIIYGDYSKLNKETGWKPQISLEQTLSDVIASM